MKLKIIFILLVLALAATVLLWGLMAAPQPDDDKEDELQMEAVRKMAEEQKRKKVAKK